jgi:hypothetical protein
METEGGYSAAFGYDEAFVRTLRTATSVERAMAANVKLSSPRRIGR